MVIERFQLRISFQDELQSLTNIKCQVENFFSLKEKVRELGVNFMEGQENTNCAIL